MNLKVQFFVLSPSSAEDDPADHPDLPPAPHHREAEAGQAGRGRQGRGRGRGDQAEGRRQPHLLVAGAGGQLYTIYIIMGWIKSTVSVQSRNGKIEGCPHLTLSN